MAARVVTQDLKVIEKAGHLWRPHLMVAAQRMGEHEDRQATLSFESIKQARIVYLGKGQALYLFLDFLLCSHGPVNWPVFFLGNLFQVRIGIYSKGIPRNLQHGKVMNGVTKTGVHLFAHHFI